MQLSSVWCGTTIKHLAFHPKSHRPVIRTLRTLQMVTKVNKR